MSLQVQTSYQIPDETQRVARAAFPKGTLGLRIADALGVIYQDNQVAERFPMRGQPAEAPARVALATVLQFVEGLSDRRADDAVRGRIDWKDALGLESAAHNPYANLLVTTPELAKDPRVLQLAKDLRSPQVAEFIRKNYQGSVIPVADQQHD